MSATLTAGGTRRHVRLVDVSERGMQLACPDPPPPDALVEVTAARISRRARVRWAERGAVGLALMEPLSPDEQAELSGMTWNH
jgi:hypothetical protein